MKLQNPSLSKISALLVLCTAAASASAQTTVLDTYGPGNAVDGWPTLVFQDSSGRQDVAIPFVIGASTDIQSILTSLDGLGGVTVGIMAKLGAVPAGNTWLYSKHLVDPVFNTAFTPSTWTLAPGNYWLAAVADNGFSGSWQSGTDTPTANWAYRDSPSAWKTLSSTFIGMPAARITISAVPEPSTYGLMLAGGLLVAGVCLRRSKNGGQA